MRQALFFASSGKKDNRFFAIDWILMIIQQQARLFFIRTKQDMRYFFIDTGHFVAFHKK